MDIFLESSSQVLHRLYDRKLQGTFLLLYDPKEHFDHIRHFQFYSRYSVIISRYFKVVLLETAPIILVLVLEFCIVLILQVHLSLRLRMERITPFQRFVQIRLAVESVRMEE